MPRSRAGTVSFAAGGWEGSGGGGDRPERLWEDRTGLVVLIDDDFTVRAVTRRMLENAGAAVTEASDGLEGLRAIQQLGAVPDLVVTDLMMPMLGGREVADVLAVFCPELPVLCLSGYPPPGDALYDGALDRRLCHLQKPFTPDELIEAARRTMARKRVARAITEEQRTAARRVWEAVAGDVPRPEGCTLTADLVTAARELRRLAQGGGA